MKEFPYNLRAKLQKNGVFCKRCLLISETFKKQLFHLAFSHWLFRTRRIKSKICCQIVILNGALAK